MTDLIPDDLLEPSHDSDYDARRLLEEAAEQLTKKTSGLVEGRVHTEYPRGETIDHQFLLVDMVRSYRYHLFSVTHGIDEYPLTIVGPGQGERQTCDSAGDFERALRDIFKALRTRKLINQLIKSAS
jgi:hypothetical protein